MMTTLGGCWHKRANSAAKSLNAFLVVVEPRCLLCLKYGGWKHFVGSGCPKN
jgi:hypothetical protein